MSTTDHIGHAERTVLEAMDTGVPYMTSEVADAADTSLSTRTVRRYLNQLEEHGHVTSRKPNQTTLLWIRQD